MTDLWDWYIYYTPENERMDTQNNGLEKATPFKHGNLLVSMLDFWGVHQS